MGYYINPHDDVAEKGRALEKASTFEELTAQLNEGEVLTAHLDRGIFKQAPCLFDQREFDEFKRQIDQGIVILLGYYAYPADAHPDAQDAYKLMTGK